MPLKILARTSLPIKEAGDLTVVGTYLLTASKKKAAKSPLDGFDKALFGAFTKQSKKDEFRGKKDQSLSMTTLGKGKTEKLIVCGLGERNKLTDADLRTFAAKAARAANAEKAKRLVIGLPEGLEGKLRYVAEGLELGAYRFAKYLTGDRKPKSEIASVTIVCVGKLPADAKNAIELGQKIAEGVNVSRDLSNEPANVIYPDTLADAAKKLGKEKGFKVTVFDYAELQKRGMKLIEAVGQGSVRKPCLVHMTYTPAKPKKKLVFVGKGITFDTGGISIKPASGMGEMKHDMSGAANCIGLMAAVLAMKPAVEVHAIIACAENMPDGNAYRPGDIFGSLDGKSVEIINTDAEGRLVLADALAYAKELAPDMLVDNATLTGACMTALGQSCSGWYANSDDAAEDFAAALTASGESMWRMPLLEDLKDQLRSDVADLKHTGDRFGGSITAALFLREFIGKTANWVHADIAGPAMADRAVGWNPKGATGHGVLTFLKLVELADSVEATAAPATPATPAK